MASPRYLGLRTAKNPAATEAEIAKTGWVRTNATSRSRGPALGVFRGRGARAAKLIISAPRQMTNAAAAATTAEEAAGPMLGRTSA